MASIQQRGSKWQVRIKHALLPRPLFVTLESEAAARSYAAQLESLLDRGIVPVELLEPSQRKAGPKLAALIDGYMRAVDVAPTDFPVLGLVRADVGEQRVPDVTARWADSWVRAMKVLRNLAPGTIRKRVGALARVIDWHIRTSVAAGQAAPANALRLMPRGYSQYSRAECLELASTGRAAKRDTARDRRLTPAELARIAAALAGHKRPDRERALAVDPAFALLFEVIVGTGLRLSEAYRLRVEQVDIEAGVLRVDGSKGERGRAKPRTVPMVPAVHQALAAWCAGRVGLVFGFWDGSPDGLKRATARLSHRFRVLFDYAHVLDFTEHDLRHEATCRWVTMRDKLGRWMWSEIEVCRIMGWSDPKMFLRYASLRGEDLAARLMA